MSILRTTHLSKRFGKFRALNDISMEVKEGEVRAIIGPNGAGKTTFFNVLTGKLKPSAGEVFFQENDITGRPPYEIVKYGIGRSFQIINVFAGLTVFENIALPVLNIYRKNMAFFSRPQLRDDIRAECFSILKKIGLENEADRIAGKLSHGDKKKLDIGISIAHRPKLLLLDEATAGLNPRENRNIMNLIREIAEREKLTIILIEHDMDAVFAVSNRITVFQQGAIIAEGRPDEVRTNKLVIDAYLGEDF